MFPDSAVAFAAHVNGIGHLLQTQRIEQYSSGVFHALFVGFRPILVGTWPSFSSNWLTGTAPDS